MSLPSQIKEYGQEIGLDIVRITSAQPLMEAAQRIQGQIDRGIIPGSATWRIKDLSSFCSPGSSLPAARSVVAVAECYLTSEPQDHSKPGEPHGRIGRYTWRNYYRDVFRKLRKLGAFLRKRSGRNVATKYYSNGPLAEKPMAERAGIGWYGKHGIIMNREHGSWIVLGELITDVELEPDNPVQEHCGSCRICIESCPTGAIVSPAILEKEKCLDYLTNWSGMIPVPYREVWGSRLYACTTCQDVCPLNLKVKPQERRPEVGHVGASVPLIPLLRMSEEDYRKRFLQNQMGARWVRRECIQRNAAIALGNIGDPLAVPALIEALENPNFMLRGHAAWALGEIGGREARVALQRARSRESHSEAKEEIERALVSR